MFQTQIELGPILRFKPGATKMCLAVFSKARITQLAEQLIRNQQFDRSNLAGRSFYLCRVTVTILKKDTVDVGHGAEQAILTLLTDLSF